MANLIFRKNGTNYTIDGLIAGTGHLIKNSSGQEVTDRQFLQFNGAYLGDDSVGDATKVNVVRTMTQAQFNALSAAEKEGFIYISDAAGQLTASEVALAAIAGMSATTVQSGIAELKSLIGSIGRTVTTLVNETVSISSGANKTYAALTATALSAYDEIHLLCGYGSVFINGIATKEEMAAVTAKTSPTSGRLYFYGGNVISGGSESLNYNIRIRADANGLNIINGSISSTLDAVRIDGIKYN